MDTTTDTTTLPLLITNQLNHFITSLPSPSSFRRFLLDLKNSQDSELFQLEQEYLTLVRDRRTNLINYLKPTNSPNPNDIAAVAVVAGKRKTLEGLKILHNNTQLEFNEFLLKRVYQDWQLGQLRKQICALREAGLPAALLYFNSREKAPKDFYIQVGLVGEVEYYQNLMKYLLNATV